MVILIQFIIKSAKHLTNSNKCKNNKSIPMKKMKHLLISCSVIFLTTSLLAQDNTQLALDIASAQEKNREQLKTYSWQRSAKASKGGEEKSQILVKIWFNSEGEMESSVLSSESTVKQQRGVRGKMQQSAGEDIGALIAQTLNLTFQYAYLSKGNWIDLMDRAEVNSGDTDVTIDAKNLLSEGDVVHYILDSSTKLFKSIEISTVAEGKAFTSSIDFKTMSDGTNHPGHTKINIPSESMEITAENIDYIKQQ